MIYRREHNIAAPENNSCSKNAKYKTYSNTEILMFHGQNEFTLYFLSLLDMLIMFCVPCPPAIQKEHLNIVKGENPEQV